MLTHQAIVEYCMQRAGEYLIRLFKVHYAIHWMSWEYGNITIEIILLLIACLRLVDRDFSYFVIVYYTKKNPNHYICRTQFDATESEAFLIWNFLYWFCLDISQPEIFWRGHHRLVHACRQTSNKKKRLRTCNYKEYE